MLCRRLSPLAFLFCGMLAADEPAAPSAPGPAAKAAPKDSLGQMSLEDLMNIPVATVVTASRTEQKITEVPAAVSVVTGEDIRRSGATRIPDALRTVPGLQVAQINSDRHAVSSRGFNEYFSNKLLVLQDGRSIYSPIHSGVFWEDQDVMLEDVEQIEVVRGPGATMWGANAVNGVINIRTKSAKDTQGFLSSSTWGTEGASESLRYGGQAGCDTWFRVWTKADRQESFDYSDGGEAHDGWETGRAGFRIDHETKADELTLEGDLFEHRYDYSELYPLAAAPWQQREKADGESSGGYILGRWRHAFSPDHDFEIQSYYDLSERRTSIADYVVENMDVDAQHRFLLNSRNQLMWGIGVRNTEDRAENTFWQGFTPEGVSQNTFSAFVQDEIGLVQDVLSLTIGSKFEQNDHTGSEVQPSARLLWTPNPKHTIWLGVSRAVRTPDRFDDDSYLTLATIPSGTFFPGAPAARTFLEGSRNIDSEELVAYEAGWRLRPTEKLLLDFAVFQNGYDGLVVGQAGARTLVPGATPRFDIPVRLINETWGETYGCELSADWKVNRRWRLFAGYSMIQMQLHSEIGQDSYAQWEGNTPRDQGFLGSRFDLLRHWEFDLTGRFVDNLPYGGISGYGELDARLGWRPSERIEFSLVGQNLLDSSHPEFRSDSTYDNRVVEVERNIFGKITLRF